MYTPSHPMSVGVDSTPSCRPELEMWLLLQNIWTFHPDSPWNFSVKKKPWKVLSYFYFRVCKARFVKKWLPHLKNWTDTLSNCPNGLDELKLKMWGYHPTISSIMFTLKPAVFVLHLCLITYLTVNRPCLQSKHLCLLEVWMSVEICSLLVFYWKTLIFFSFPEKLPQ